MATERVTIRFACGHTHAATVRLPAARRDKSVARLKRQLCRSCRDAERSPFLSAIAARPGDPVPWLVYADWLAEQGATYEESIARARAARLGGYARV